MLNDDPVARLEKKLHSLNRSRHLDKLVTDGCERKELLFGLELVEIYMSRDRWERLAGMSLKQLNATIRQIDRMADTIDKLNSHAIFSMATFLDSTADQDLRPLPGVLRRYVAILRAHQSLSGPKSKPFLNYGIANLVACVLDRTGNPHDNEVGELLAAILGPEWNTDSLKVWRRRHRSEVTVARSVRREEGL
jgi:hypothetical protein